MMRTPSERKAWIAKVRGPAGKVVTKGVMTWPDQDEEQVALSAAGVDFRCLPPDMKLESIRQVSLRILRKLQPIHQLEEVCA